MRIIIALFLFQYSVFGGLQITVEEFPCYQEKRIQFSLDAKLNKAIKIVSSKTGCSCLKVKFDKKSFSLGEEISGELFIPAHGLFGRFSKNIYIEYDNDLLVIDVVGRATEDFDVKPSRNISFDQVKKGALFSKKINIFPNSDKLTLLEPEIQILEGELNLKMTRTTKGWVASGKSLKKGLFKVKLIFKVLGKERPPLVIEAYGIAS